MKKFLLTLGVLGLVVSSASAYEAVTGKVQKIEQWEAANAYYIIDKNDNTCVRKAIAGPGLGVDGTKTFNAIILTAMSTGKMVTVTADALTPCNDAAPAIAHGIILVNDQ